MQQMPQANFDKVESHCIREREQHTFGFRYGGEIPIIKNEGAHRCGTLIVDIANRSYELRHVGDSLIVPAGNITITSRDLNSVHTDAARTTIECRHYKCSCDPYQ